MTSDKIYNGDLIRKLSLDEKYIYAFTQEEGGIFATINLKIDEQDFINMLINDIETPIKYYNAILLPSGKIWCGRNKKFRYEE